MLFDLTTREEFAFFQSGFLVGEGVEVSSSQVLILIINLLLKTKLTLEIGFLYRNQYALFVNKNRLICYKTPKKNYAWYF